MSDARRIVTLYSTIKDRKSPLKGSRPSVPHGTNFFNPTAVTKIQGEPHQQGRYMYGGRENFAIVAIYLENNTR